MSPHTPATDVAFSSPTAATDMAGAA